MQTPAQDDPSAYGAALLRGERPAVEPVPVETAPKLVTVDSREMLRLLDHVDSLVRFCAANMVDARRFYAGSNALRSVAYRLAGNDREAQEFASKVPDQVLFGSPEDRID